MELKLVKTYRYINFFCFPVSSVLMFTHQADCFADESRSGTCTHTQANKVKMCHNTKVNMSLCHLQKAVAWTDGVRGGGGWGGPAFSPESKPPPLLPPMFRHKLNQNNWNSAAEWPLWIHHRWELSAQFFSFFSLLCGWARLSPGKFHAVH